MFALGFIIGCVVAYGVGLFLKDHRIVKRKDTDKEE